MIIIANIIELLVYNISAVLGNGRVDEIFNSEYMHVYGTFQERERLVERFGCLII